MKEKFQKLPLRNGVGIAVLNKENKIFVAKRIDNPADFWQMPQGGIDEGENYFDAALRELKEETSIKSVELVKEISKYTTYDQVFISRQTYFAPKASRRHLWANTGTIDAENH